MSTDVRERLLADGYAANDAALAEAKGKDPLLDAFVAWVLPDRQNKERISEIVDCAGNRQGAERTYRDVAALGYCLPVGGPSQEGLTALTAGLEWLAGRKVDTADVPTGIAVDAVALLGIMLASQRVVNAELSGRVHSWFRSFLDRSMTLPLLGAWRKTILGVVHHLMVNQSGEVIYGEAADVLIALRAKGVLSRTDLPDEDGQIIEALQILTALDVERIDPYRAAFKLAAYDWIRLSAMTINPHAPTLDDVAHVLERMECGFERWTWEDNPRTRRNGAEARKWHIDNEYHVQNALWFLLAPIFHDLRYEEFGNSIGQLQPRVDLEIPSLRIIIEAKYMYARDTPSAIIRQIAEDASLYLIGERAEWKILPVVWDDSHRVESHAQMKRGLKEMKGVVFPVVISRPGKMSREAG